MNTFYGNSSDNNEIFLQDIKREHIYKTSIKSYENNLSIYDKSIAKFYGFNSKVNFLAFIFFIFIFFINNTFLLFARLFSYLSICFKFFSLLIEFLVYFSKKGYKFKSSILRIYSNQISRLKKWHY